MGPETLYAQVLPTLTDPWVSKRMKECKGSFKEAWNDKFSVLEMDEIWNRTDTMLKLQFANGKIMDLTADDIHHLVYEADKPLCISANGTIFRTDKEAVIPGLLARWYSERKQMQAKKKEAGASYREEKDQEKAKLFKEQEGYWDRMQQARKILLNSLYGALLNEAMRFYDKRIGQSVTLTGRCIVRHMCAEMNRIITGKYDYKGEAVVYSDTDSCYFTAKTIFERDPELSKIQWTKENAVTMYDKFSEEVNQTFPGFLHKTFNVPESRAVIKAGRELVASAGIFANKKRYAVLIYDLEGVRTDIDKQGNPTPGKLKAMGLDIKRSDTPEFVQDFLKEVLLKSLQNVPDKEVIDYIREFRLAFRKRRGWEMGSPKGINGLTSYQDRLDKFTKNIPGGVPPSKVPGHVRAAIAWNEMRDRVNDKYTIKIQDGHKIYVCKLKSNKYGYGSIAFPVDEPHIDRVSWFTEMPFDVEAMEVTLIDKKLKNVIGPLKMDLSSTFLDKETADLFEF
jgi:hypothetical protein